MEIYLTRMILNPQCPEVRRDLGNPQELHKTVSSGFPNVENQNHLPKHLRETPRNLFNILHRLEFDKLRGQAVLLIQSTLEPDWGSLPRGFANELECKAIHNQYAAIENGMKLIFRLHANPSKRDKSKFSSEKPKQRKRYALFRDEDRIDWLRAQGERLGFRLIESNQTVVKTVCVEEGLLVFKRDKTEPKITLGSVLFEGVLVVTEAEKFRDAIVRGIGTGKAYGLGLLSIARPQ